MPNPLLIDIQTILKMIRFSKSFREGFMGISSLSNKNKDDLEQYIENIDVSSKSNIWEWCCIEDNIVNINEVIMNWRNTTNDHKEIENTIKVTPETKYGYDIIGKIIKSEKYSDLIKEIRENKFHYNGISVINSNNTQLHFFY
jgi:hypothetical protein